MSPENVYHRNVMSERMDIHQAAKTKDLLDKVRLLVWEKNPRIKGDHAILHQHTTAEMLSRSLVITRQTSEHLASLTTHVRIGDQAEQHKLLDKVTFQEQHGEGNKYIILPSGFIIPDRGEISCAQQQIQAMDALQVFGFLLTAEEVLTNW